MSRDGFFYGLFMDEALLRGKGLNPQHPRKATVKDYKLSIGKRAMLVPQPGALSYGMVFTMDDRELEALYAESGLELYRPESVRASFEDGTSAVVTTYNLERSSVAEERDAAYAAKLGAVLERLGFPAAYVRSVRG